VLKIGATEIELGDGGRFAERVRLHKDDFKHELLLETMTRETP